ncbi:unnamed protein product, partial [Owenia fusiformis]
MLKEDDSGHFTFSHEEDVYSLKIQDVTPEDSGTYTCKAKNDLGEDSTSASLTVKAELKEQEVTPEFSEKLEDIKDVEQGKAAEFRVKVKAFPDAEISWCKDDVLLKEDDSGHFTFSHEEDVHSLKIQDV